jgi:glycosyltransferase involved in cell wall biosynthesis
MAKKKKILVMISQQFPFGFGEVYLERELRHFAQCFDEVLLYPLSRAKNKRSLPTNVSINEMFCKRSSRVNKKYAIKKLLPAIQIISQETKLAHQGIDYLKANKKEFLAQLIMAYELADLFFDSFKEQVIHADIKYYSVWLDEGALVMSLLKKSGKISSFVFRLHGYDLYDSRREGNYMPFRAFCFNQVSKIFVVSKKGADYTKSLNICPEKVSYNYSGLDDHGLTSDFNGEVRLMSCSNLIDLKRVHLIIEVLERIKIPITWKHFGDGATRSDLENRAKKLPANVNWSFEGHVTYEKLMQSYSKQHWTCFLHMSESEGLPLALVEAMSFGIPVVACDVGGVSEVISNDTGLLLDKNPNLDQVVEFINHLNKNAVFRSMKSKASRLKFENDFEAAKNYKFFVNQVMDT